MRMLILSLFLSGSAFGATAAKPCTLPVLGEAVTSAPSFKGKVKSVGAGGKVMEATDSASAAVVSVKMPPAAYIWSAFGGLLELKDIKVGNTFRAWAKGCAKPVKNALSPVIVIVDK